MYSYYKYFYYLFILIPILVRSLTTSCNSARPVLFLSNILKGLDTIIGKRTTKYFYLKASMRSLGVRGLLVCLLIICRNFNRTTFATHFHRRYLFLQVVFCVNNAFGVILVLANVFQEYKWTNNINDRSTFSIRKVKEKPAMQ